VEYTPQSVLCRVEIQGKAGFLIDASYDRTFRDFLFSSMEKNHRIKNEEGVLEFNSSVFAKIDVRNGIESKILKSDQSNTAIIYNDQYFFKFYRRIEMLRFLSENTSFTNSPRYAGSVEFKDSIGKVMVFGLMQEKVENQGEAWGMAVDSVGRFFERVMTRAKNEKLPKLINKPAIKFEEAPEIIQEFIGRGFYERVVRLGQRTAEMHLALASDSNDPAFSPEPFTANYQRAMYSSLRKLVRDRLNLLENSLDKLDAATQVLAKKVLGLEKVILESFKEVYEVRINAIKTRVHGDYHLGQVLFTGKDFIIIDFEGEPGFSFSERRLKKNPFKDVAGMMRSFHYAAFGKILLNENYRDRDLEFLEAWADQWQHYVSRFYLGAYMDRMGMGTSLSSEYDTLVRTFLVEKAIYELGYELNGRPDWTKIPLRGIDYLMGRYLKEREEKDKKKK
jgi:maltose alpha-D-glucosyltransferase / alpha-amylase